MKLIGGLALVAATFGFAASTQEEVKKGSKAAEFTATGSDDKEHSLKSLSEKGPVVLYFIKIGCPVNHQAAPHFKKIYDTYGKDTNLVGVINGSPADAQAWKKEYKADFLILADPDHKIIRKYGAQYSPWAVSVEEGKLSNIWEGGSPAELKLINEAVAKQTKKDVAKLVWTGAPSGGG